MDSSKPTHDILESIVRAKRNDLEILKMRAPQRSLIARAAGNAPRDFYTALAGEGIAIIAELKKASPSAGILRREYHPVEIARGYETGGAAALSVLTEERYFQGSLDHLIAARGAVSIPVLRKDFIIDEYQIYESAAAGADAVLLIARILSREQLARLVDLCHELRLSPLVEIYGEDDIDKAKASRARIFGINNRDLRSGEVNIDRTISLKGLLPAKRVIVSESGIKSAGDLKRLAREGVRAALIGESLLRQADPGRALADLKRELIQEHGQGQDMRDHQR